MTSTGLLAVGTLTLTTSWVFSLATDFSTGKVLFSINP